MGAFTPLETLWLDALSLNFPLRLATLRCGNEEYSREYGKFLNQERAVGEVVAKILEWTQTKQGKQGLPSPNTQTWFGNINSEALITASRTCLEEIAVPIGKRILEWRNLYECLSTLFEVVAASEDTGLAAIKAVKQNYDRLGEMIAAVGQRRDDRLWHYYTRLSILDCQLQDCRAMNQALVANSQIKSIAGKLAKQARKEGTSGGQTSSGGQATTGGKKAEAITAIRTVIAAE